MKNFNDFLNAEPIKVKTPDPNTSWEPEPGRYSTLVHTKVGDWDFLETIQLLILFVGIFLALIAIIEFW